jgi:hypothetical protein
VDFALVEVVDIDVVVVIRFVAMEIIPRKRLAQGKPEAKLKIDGIDGGRRPSVQDSAASRCVYVKATSGFWQ